MGTSIAINDNTIPTIPSMFKNCTATVLAPIKIIKIENSTAINSKALYMCYVFPSIFINDKLLSLLSSND